MIDKRAIEKAIEGGWATYKGEPIEFYFYDECRPKWQEIALDPLFWQALGKALEWSDYTQVLHYYDQDRWNRDCTHSKNEVTWQHNARCFYNLILTGGDTDAFWKDLLT
jgi:hypothetical protein